MKFKETDSDVWFLFNNLTFLGPTRVKYSVNQSVTGDLAFQKATDTFVQWKGGDGQVYGMTFDLQTPASQYAEALSRAVSRITGVALPAPVQAAIPEPITTTSQENQGIASSSSRPTSTKDRPVSGKEKDRPTSGKDKEKKEKEKKEKEKEKEKEKKDKRKSQLPNSQPSSGGIPAPISASSEPINESPEEAMKRKRRMAAREIYTSEEVYVKYLQDIQTLWKAPLKSKGIVTDSEHAVLFGNIDTLVQVNIVLMNELKLRMEIWTDSTKIGDVFVKNAMYLRAYKSYCETYNDAQNILASLATKKSYTQYAKSIQEASQALPTLLACPFSRIPRYLLLLREVLNRTPAEHPDYPDLQEALKQMASIASELEKGIADAQFAKRLQAVISRNYIGLSPLLVPHRILHTEGEIDISVNGQTRANVALLFNDVIAFVLDTPKEKRVVSHTAFDTLWLVELPSEMSSNANAFELQTPEVTFRCTAKDRITRDLLFEEIDKQIVTDLTMKGALLGEAGAPSSSSSSEGGIPAPIVPATPGRSKTSERVRKATYKWEAGGMYEGEWVNAKMHGRGKRTSSNGSSFEGQFVKGCLHGHGRAEYKTGDVYEGEWARDVPHGKGTLTIKTSLGEKRYDGEWETGRKKGHGRMQWENGDVYEGGWEHDVFHGRGKLEKKDGSRYEGDWLHGARHGAQGSYVGPLGERYEGAWHANQKHGKGGFAAADGSTYSGDFVADQRQGTGTYTMAEGHRYEGEFMANLFTGHGTLTEANGDVYAGHWRAGRKHGIGTLTRSNGDKYEGAWAEDKKHGKGVLTTRAGLTYDGDWKDDKRHGLGSLTLPGGTSYSGEWAMDLRDGKGKEIWPNGAIYDGHWKTDLRHGHGSFTWPDSSLYVGNWVLGKRSGQGTLKTSAGMYDGEWLDDLRHGHGVWTSSDGSSFSGEWSSDRRNGKGLLNNISEQIWKDGLIVKPGVQHFPPDLPAPFYFN